MAEHFSACQYRCGMDQDRGDIGLHHLRHAVAVADEAHFGRAAKRLGMAQPPLSQSIARLERALGARLFGRGGRFVRPTEAGAAFLAEARTALAAAARAAALARAAARAGTPVRIGFTSQALWHALPELLSAAHRAGIRVELHELPTARQLAALTEGELDLALVAPPFEPLRRVTVRDLGAERLVAALPAGRAPADGAAVGLASLSEDLILFPAVQGPALHGGILAAFRAAGLTPRIVQEAPRMATILTLVAAGLGCALVPEGVRRRLPMPGVGFHELADGGGLPRWPLALAHLPLAATGSPARLLSAWRAHSER